MKSANRKDTVKSANLTSVEARGLVIVAADDDVKRFATLGLGAMSSGYTATANILEAEFKEMRGRYMALQVNFRSTKAVREPTLLLVHLALNPRAYYRLYFWDHPSGRV